MRGARHIWPVGRWQGGRRLSQTGLRGSRTTETAGSSRACPSPEIRCLPHAENGIPGTEYAAPLNNRQDDTGGVVCIVVVDDEPELRDLVSSVLEDEGYEVLSFAHPLPVTTLNRTDEHPDLFIIDIMLPDMNGIALAARLKDEGFFATPKIAMSASRDMLHVAEESNLFDATVSKPFDLDDLLGAVESHLGGEGHTPADSL